MDPTLPVAALAALLQGEAPATAPAPGSAWALEFAADAWFPRLVGEITRGGPAMDTRDLGLSGSEAAFAGELAVRVDRWRLAASGFTFSTSGETNATSAFAFGGIDVGAGDRLATSADWWGVGLDLSYDLWRPLEPRPFPWSDATPGVARPERVDFSIRPDFGLSYLDFAQSLEDRTLGQSTDFSGQWLAIRFGADLDATFRTRDLVGFVDRFTIGFGASAGPTVALSGGDTGWIVALEASLAVFFHPNVAARIGYRYLDADLEGDGGTAEVSLQGLFAGLEIAW